MKRALFIFAFTAAVVTFATLTPGKKNGMTPSAKAESYMENVSATSKRGSEHLWSLSAKRAVFSEDSKLADMQSVTLFIPREGMTVEAESGTYNIDSRELSLVGGVKAKTEDFVIETSAINVLTDSEEIRSEEKVRLQCSEFTIEGVGLRAGGEGRIRLLKDVNATFF